MICFGVDRPSPWWTGSFIENPTFIEPSLSDVKVSMVIMSVLVVRVAVLDIDRTDSNT
jgi:hypothetical protein